MGKSILNANKEEATVEIAPQGKLVSAYALFAKENGTAISAIVTGLSAWIYGQKEVGIAGIVLGVGSIVTKYLAKFLGNIG